MVIWLLLLGAVLIILSLAYGLCIAAARADLRSLHDSVTFDYPPDPDVRIYGGPYDGARDFDGD